MFLSHGNSSPCPSKTQATCIVDMVIILQISGQLTFDTLYITMQEWDKVFESRIFGVKAGHS